MNHIDKKELAKRISKRSGISAEKSYRSIDVMIDVVKEAILNGEKVNFAGLVAFHPTVLTTNTVYNFKEKRTVRAQPRPNVKAVFSRRFLEKVRKKTL